MFILTHCFLSLSRVSLRLLDQFPIQLRHNPSDFDRVRLIKNNVHFDCPLASASRISRPPLKFGTDLEMSPRRITARSFGHYPLTEAKGRRRRNGGRGRRPGEVEHRQVDGTPKNGVWRPDGFCHKRSLPRNQNTDSLQKKRRRKRAGMVGADRWRTALTPPPGGGACGHPVPSVIDGRSISPSFLRPRHPTTTEDEWLGDRAGEFATENVNERKG